MVKGPGGLCNWSELRDQLNNELDSGIQFNPKTPLRYIFDAKVFFCVALTCEFFSYLFVKSKESESFEAIVGNVENVQTRTLITNKQSLQPWNFKL